MSHSYCIAEDSLNDDDNKMLVADKEESQLF